MRPRSGRQVSSGGKPDDPDFVRAKVPLLRTGPREAEGALGIGDQSVVVAYDDTGGLTAGRLVTMLRMLGRDAALLDGGLAVWVAEGRPVVTGPAER